MINQKKQLFVLSGLVILLSCILIAVLTIKARSDRDTSSHGEDDIVVFSLDGAIKNLQVWGKQSYFIKREDDGVFYVSKPQDMLNSNSSVTDQYAVSNERMDEITRALSNVTASTVIENVADLTQYGLDEPLFTVQIQTDGAGQKVYSLEIGDFSEGASMYYARTDDSNDVYLITTLVEIALDYSVEELSKK